MCQSNYPITQLPDYPIRYICIALSNATLSATLSDGCATLAMPSASTRTGSAAARARVPDVVSGATKQLALLRDRPAIAATTAAAADASAYGPGGHSAAMRAASLRRDGSSS